MDSGWSMDTDLSASDTSFWSEESDDRTGWSVAGGGDVNGDGYDDILIGADYNADGGYRAGQTYLIFPDHNSPPTTIINVKAYSDASYTYELNFTYQEETIYLELQGLDMNTSRGDIALVNVSSSGRPQRGFTLRLLETDLNTGVYRGSITIANRTHDRYKWINASAGGWVNVSSRQDPSKSVNLNLGLKLRIRPKLTNVDVAEDSFYTQQFRALDVIPDSWSFSSNASWLAWNPATKELNGTPDNSHLGTYWVNVTVGWGSMLDYTNFTLTVENTNPEITTENVLRVYQDQEYRVDYNCSDDGQGIISWGLQTNATWLSMNGTSGMLYGIPGEDDLGVFDVNVTVDDGNGGWDFTHYVLEVMRENVPPILSDGNVTPGSGNVSTNFTFSVLYMDMDGDPPAYVRVHIDGSPYELEPTRNSEFNSGVEYSYIGNLSEGIGKYYFTASDGTYYARFPLLGNLSTPDVKSITPDISDIVPPTINLTSPVNGTTINTTNATLQWTYENQNPGTLLSFDIYFGENASDVGEKKLSAPYQSNIANTSFTLKNLSDGKTYYWKVVGKIYGINDTFDSPVWFFTVKVGFIPVHNITLSLDNYRLQVLRGNTTEVDLNISNNGDLREKVLISLSGNFKGNVTVIPSVTLDPGEFEKVRIKIFTNELMGLGTYFLTVIATYSGYDREIQLEIEILDDKKEIVEGPARISPPSYLWVWLVVIAVVLLAVVIVIIILRSKKKKEKTVDAAEELIADIEHVPSGGIKSDIPAAQIVARQAQYQTMAGSVQYGYVKREPMMRGPVQRVPDSQGPSQKLHQPGSPVPASRSHPELPIDQSLLHRSGIQPPPPAPGQQPVSNVIPTGDPPAPPPLDPARQAPDGGMEMQIPPPPQ